MMSPEVKKTLKIVVCGSQEVGKTWLTNKLTHTQELFDSYTPTIGVEYKTRYLFDRDIKLAFWDLSGSEKFEKVTYPYVVGKGLLIFVYNVNDMESVERIEKLNTLYQEKGWFGKGIIVGINSDVMNNNASYIKSEAIELSTKCGYPHFFVDMDNNTGLQDLEVYLLRILKIDEEHMKRVSSFKRKSSISKVKKKWTQEVVDCVCGKKCTIM